MIYQLTTLMREVRIVMDKNMTSTALRGLGDVDTLSVSTSPRPLNAGLVMFLSMTIRTSRMSVVN